MIVVIRLRRLTGIKQGTFLIMYLGCPLFYERRNSKYLKTWLEKLLRESSYRQEEILENMERWSLKVLCIIKYQLAIHKLIWIKFPWTKRMSQHWSKMVKTLQRYQPNIHYLLVRWKMLIEGWVTCNMDEASKKTRSEFLWIFYTK